MDGVLKPYAARHGLQGGRLPLVGRSHGPSMALNMPKIVYRGPKAAEDQRIVRQSRRVALMRSLSAS